MPGFALKKKEHSEEEILGVLHSIGKSTKKDELNCSSCGYPTCRDKAIAVLDGKANLEMCLPFLMERAKSFSNNIVESTLNPILVCDENFVIQLANPALQELVGVKNAKDLVGKNVASLFDCTLYSLALGGTPIKSKKIYLPDYERYLYATIVYDERFHIIIAVYRDVTNEEKQQQKDREMVKATAKITSEVIEKNMTAKDVDEMAAKWPSIYLSRLSEASRIIKRPDYASYCASKKTLFLIKEYLKEGEFTKVALEIENDGQWHLKLIYALSALKAKELNAEGPIERVEM